MRTDGVQEDQLQENVPLNQILSRLMPLTVDQIIIAFADKVMESVLDHIPIDHIFIALLDLPDLVFDFVFKNLVEVLDFIIDLLLGSVGRHLLQGFVHEHFEGRQLQDGCVGGLEGEVCVVDGVAGQSAGHSGGIGSVVIDNILNCEEISQ